LGSLPGLPVELWTPKGFEYLGNALGRYMDVDMSFKDSRKMSMAHILVSMNIRKGLAEEIELSWGDKSIMKKLDYEGIPFKCRRCHKHGHNASECPFFLCGGKRSKGQWGQARRSEVPHIWGRLTSNPR
jgi:hypothetical protein